MPAYSPIFGVLTLSGRKALTRRYFRTGRSTRVIRELYDTLVNGAVGATAALTQVRVKHSQVELGGLRPVETQTLINRATVAADATDLTDYLSEDSKIATPNDVAGGGRTKHPAWPA